MPFQASRPEGSFLLGPVVGLHRHARWNIVSRDVRYQLLRCGPARVSVAHGKKTVDFEIVTHSSTDIPTPYLVRRIGEIEAVIGSAVWSPKIVSSALPSDSNKNDEVSNTEQPPSTKSAYKKKSTALRERRRRFLPSFGGVHGPNGGIQ